MTRLFAFMIIALFFSSALATPLILEADYNYKITKEAQFLYDLEGNLDINDIMAINNWQEIDRNRINFGFIDSPVWVQFSIKGSDSPNWIIRLSYPLLDFLDIYITKNKKIISESHTGDLRPFHNRTFNEPQFSHPIRIEKDVIYQIFLRVDTNGSAELPIAIEEKHTFVSENRLRNLARGFINGIFVIMILYNLIIYLFIKDTSYAFYVLNAIVYLIQLSIFDGSGFQYFWPENPEYNLYAFPFFNGLMQLTQFLFLVVFLEILSRKAWYVTPVKCVIAMMIPLPILGITMDYEVIIPIQVLFAIFVNIAGMAFGLYYSFKGETSARYFTLAWFLFLLGLLIINLKSFGLIPNNIYTEYSYQIGAFIEMTLLSLALAQRIQSSQKKVIQLQNENIETLEKYQDLYQNSLSGQFQMNKNGNIQNMNPACFRMLNLTSVNQTSTEHKSHNINDLMLDTSDLTKIQSALSSNEKIINEEIQLKTGDGQIRWFSISIRPVKEMGNNIQNFDVSVLDIHERKINHDIKERSMMDRMSSLEQLAIGICHEINTPLGVTVTASSHLKELMDDIKISFDSGQLTKNAMEEYLSDERSALDLIEAGLNRTSQLITQFKQVSVKQLGIKVSESTIISILDEVKSELKGILSKNDVHFNIQCPDEIKYHGPCDALKMIFSELIENSIIHGLNPNQTLDISIYISLMEDNIEIVYQDNGAGVQIKNTEELFNAFYTTKRGLNGRIGLGLYKLYNLATQLLKGSIEYIPADNPTFKITFPSKGTDTR